MPNVDSLNISITGTAQRASSSLDTVIRKLDTLSGSLRKINTSSLNGMTMGFERLGRAMTSLNAGSFNKADFNRLASGIERLSRINSAQINSSADALNRLSKSINFMAGTNAGAGATQIADLARGIAQLGYKSSTQAIENIPRLATAMRQLMTELSKAPKVSQNLIDMTNALAKLSRTGSSSGRAVNSLSSVLGKFSASTKRAKSSSLSLAGAIGKVYATYWMLFRAFNKIKQAIDISSQLTETQNVVNTVFGDFKNKIEDLSKTSIVEYGMSELSVKKISSQFQAMGTTMGYSQSKMSDMSVELTKLTADMASFYNLSHEEVAEDLQSIFTGQARPLRQYGLDLTEATLKEFALSNGLNANIKSMSQAEKTMLRYQYVMANTGAAQGDFARTSMTWANQVKILKENFKALATTIGGTFINAFKPMVIAINNAMGAFQAFAKTVSDSLGKIFGWQYEDGTSGLTNGYDDAADSAADIEDSTKKTADNIKKGLRAFDELKTISLANDDKKNNGGDSGGMESTEITALTGQWKRADSIFKDYESSLDSLYKLGDYIGTALTTSLKNINWNNVYSGAKNFGAGLASFMNGLITPDLFGALGTTIAGALNTALNSVNSYLKERNWSNLGSALATGISNFLKTFDLKLAGETLSNFVSSIINGITGFLVTLNDENAFKTLGQKIVDFICGIKWGKLLWDLAGLFGALVMTIVKAPQELLTGISDAIKQKVQEAWNGIKTWWNEDEHIVAFKASVKGVIQKSFEKMKAAWDSIKNKVSTLTAKAKESVKNGLKNIKDKWDGIKTKTASLTAKAKESVKNGLKNIKEKWDSIKTKTSTLTAKAKNASSEILATLKNRWDLIKNKTATLTGKAKNSMGDAIKKIEDAWSSIKTKTVELTAKFVDNFTAPLKKAWNALAKAINTATSKLNNAFGLNIGQLYTFPGYATGGFPEDGTFRASHGEIMGRFDNGKSVVANNRQITEGISAAVYQGNRENNALLRQEIQLMQTQNELLSRILEKETGISAKELFNSVRKSAYEYNRRTGSPAF